MQNNSNCSELSITNPPSSSSRVDDLPYIEGEMSSLVTFIDDCHHDSKYIDLEVNGISEEEEEEMNGLSIHQSDDVTEIYEFEPHNSESTEGVGDNPINDDDDDDDECIDNNRLIMVNLVVEEDSSSSPPPSSSSSSPQTNKRVICLCDQLNDERGSLNGPTYETISHLSNGHETIFFDKDRSQHDDDDDNNDDDDDDVARQICNGNSVKLLKTLHFKSASTSTEECVIELRHEGCQCHPEEFIQQHLNETSCNDNSNNNNNDNNDDDDDDHHIETSHNDQRRTTATTLDAIRMRQDILNAQDKMQALDSTLKTMRAEKLDLLGQMRHLYATLESKEEDMNIFIRNFETKISEGNELISRLISEKSHLERTNQDMEMKLQHALDQCVSLNLDLDLKNQVIEQLNIQLESSQVSRSDSNLSSIKMANVTMETNFSRSPTDDELLKPRDWRGEHPPSSEASQNTSMDKGLSDGHNTSLSSKDVKLMPLLSEVLQINIEQWKANHILVWLEQDLKMGYYSQQCRDNVKSGKVLLTMTDQELDSAFGLQSPIHRKKLRIAIDHLSNPKLKKFPLADQLETSWITGEWLPSLGLPQFGPVFEAQLVDGRMLDYLTPKELEKNFTMISKTHVSSLLSGVQLLRMFDFDRKMVEERRSGRSSCLYWTNEDVIRWLEDIDLQEYSPNLKKSGVHGALMVLEDKFTSLQLAMEVGLSSSKSYLLRHLTQEFKEVVVPAKFSLTSEFRLEPEGKTRTLSRALSSSSSKSRREDFFSSSLSFKGSLGRAFGKKVKKDLIQVVPTSEPVRMPTELLTIFDLPTSRDDPRASTICPASMSAFSSMQSLPIAHISNNLSKSDLSSLSPPSIIVPLESKKSDGDRSTLVSEELSSNKFKTPKNSRYFSLRVFSGSSRRKSCGAK